MTIPQEAIEAATQALSIHWKAPHTNEALGRQRALAEHALTAALPALEQQIREQVAAEILGNHRFYECHEQDPQSDNHPHACVWEIVQSAAQIARGKDKS